MTFTYAEGVHSDAHGGSIMPDMLRWIWRDYPGVASFNSPKPSANP
jgi:enterochelin esterase family protein